MSPSCALRYAVYGERRYCPVCGALPANVVTLDALAANWPGSIS